MPEDFSLIELGRLGYLVDDKGQAGTYRRPYGIALREGQHQRDHHKCEHYDLNECYWDRHFQITCSTVPQQI